MSKKRIRRPSTSGKKHAPSGVVRTSDRREIPLADLKSILARVRSGAAISEEEVAKLEGAVDTLATLTQELEAKGASLAKLRGMLFGARTETTRNVVGDAPAEAAAEDGSPSRETGDAEDGAASSSSDDTDDADAAEKTKHKGHGRHGSEDYKGAKKVKVALESLKSGGLCPACERGKLYPLPSSVLVRVTGMAPLAAIAYELEKLRCNACGEVFTAKAPDGVGEDKYDESAAAMIALLKYGCGLPFHRLERLEGDLGIPLPASTQWEVIAPAAAKLEPVFTELIDHAAQGDVLHNDDTHAKVLELSDLIADAVAEDDPGKKRTGVYTSGIVSVEGERRIALFFTGHKHAGENLADVLKKRAAELPPPIQMSDALPANTAEGRETLRAGCNAHARRKYVEVADAFPDEVRHVLEEWKIVFENDAFAKAQAMSKEERLTYHQERSGPVMERLEKWCRAQIDERRVEPNGGLGQAIAHMQKHWEKLTLFLRVPGAPLENNICERALKKAILHRKNALFFKTENGAKTGDIFMSLIHTCELNGTNPFDYLVAMLRHPVDVEESPEDWMPWNYTRALAELDALAATHA
ncbi:MAG TPA: IS66 family transposase [Opitutales bacterium]|nr:IS66 family transposase [Opitutales bacterium]